VEQWDAAALHTSSRGSDNRSSRGADNLSSRGGDNLSDSDRHNNFVQLSLPYQRYDGCRGYDPTIDCWRVLGHASAIEEESKNLLAECEIARWRAQV